MKLPGRLVLAILLLLAMLSGCKTNPQQEPTAVPDLDRGGCIATATGPFTLVDNESQYRFVYLNTGKTTTIWLNYRRTDTDLIAVRYTQAKTGQVRYGTISHLEGLDLAQCAYDDLVLKVEAQPDTGRAPEDSP